MSVKDVLARAAAKGLLEGIDLAKPTKREEKKKKKQKVTQPKTPAKEAVLQSKIQEFLNREMKPDNSVSDSAVPNVNASTSQTLKQTNSAIQLKKTKPLTNSSLPVMSKNISSIPSFQKVLERQRRKPKLEDNKMILKPVEIVLPPVMMPYFNPQGNRSQISTSHHYYRWVGTIGTKSGRYDMLSPSASKKLIRSKETSSPSTLKHPRPWL